MTTNFRWNEPRIWEAGETLDALGLNSVSDNMNFLKSMPRGFSDELTADITTTSTTFVDTGIGFFIPVVDGDIMISFSGVMRATASTEMQTDVFNVTENVFLSSGTSTPSTNGLFQHNSGASGVRHIYNFLVWELEKPANVYEYKLYWRTSVAATLTLQAAGIASPRFWGLQR